MGKGKGGVGHQVVRSIYLPHICSFKTSRLIALHQYFDEILQVVLIVGILFGIVYEHSMFGAMARLICSHLCNAAGRIAFWNPYSH
jgi:hypothetical protein